MISAVGLGLLMQIDKLKSERDRQLDMPVTAEEIAPILLDKTGKQTKESKNQNEQVA